jgi:hypothetical protein
MRLMVYAAAACVVATLGVSGQAADVSLSTLTWLTGDWRLAAADNRTVEEHWTAPAANALIGMSRTVRDDRMVAFEFLRIEQREKDIFYVAQPNGRPPTDFKLSSAADGELVFEGDGKDRVKRITYRRQGPNGLYALVEGEERGKPFRLEYRYTRGVPAFPRPIDSPPARPLR